MPPFHREASSEEKGRWTLEVYRPLSDGVALRSLVIEEPWKRLAPAPIRRT